MTTPENGLTARKDEHLLFIKKGSTMTITRVGRVWKVAMTYVQWITFATRDQLLALSFYSNAKPDDIITLSLYGDEVCALITRVESIA